MAPATGGQAPAAGSTSCEATNTPDAPGDAGPADKSVDKHAEGVCLYIAWPAASNSMYPKTFVAGTRSADGPRMRGAAHESLLTTRTTPHLRTLTPSFGRLLLRPW